ncbi:hypothetical protein DL89DRAFT_289436 [Linderina pennispora]|uniref:Uncharacterized protein n=1 Tax=Linderina pennispora TaxID=61395 RepID=A0A1Y1WK19_9FUNG|nr:uncharacterized protein DL89DRAFT_289436 [Linderina pennispora]ORX73705.1 hypothetical protein DL89DRAFT_289436 [Linderina pennispora]
MSDMEEFLNSLVTRKPADAINDFEAALREPAERTNASDSFGDNAFDNSDNNSDSDDPTNIAMFLDEADEHELQGVTPGTPMALEKLGELTAKSISRQKRRQTPARSNGTGSLLRRSSQYSDAGSPSKRGKESNLASLMDNIASITTPTAISRSRGAQAENDEEPTQSVLRIRSSHRATGILDRIKGSSEALAAATTVNPHQTPRAPIFITGTPIRAPGSTQLSDDESQFLSASLDSIGPSRQQQETQDDQLKTYQTPATRSGAPRGTNSYRHVRALSDRSSGFSASNESIEDDYEKPLPISQYMRTPNTPRQRHNERMGDLRRFYGGMGLEHAQQAPSAEELAQTNTSGHKDTSSLILGADATSQQQGAAGGLDSGSVSPSPVGPGKRAHQDQSLLGSPTQLSTANQQTNVLDSDMAQLADNSTAPNIQQEKAGRGLSPAHFSFGQQIDLDDQITADDDNRSKHTEPTSTIHSSLREPQHQTGLDELDASIAVIDRAEQDLNRSIANLAAARTKQIVLDPQAQLSAAKELEEHVQVLRKMMEETKTAVFAIQRELESIMKLLSSLDLRLDMLETSKVARDPVIPLLPVSAGSAKVIRRDTPRWLLDTAKRIATRAVDSITQNPLLIVGILVAVLLAELFVLSGVYNVLVLKQHVALPPPLS